MMIAFLRVTSLLDRSRGLWRKCVRQAAFRWRDVLVAEFNV